LTGITFTTLVISEFESGVQLIAMPTLWLPFRTHKSFAFY